MTLNKEKNSDDRNTGFGARVKLANHKPGFDQEIEVQEQEHEYKGKDSDGNHRFQKHKEKNIPQTTLADRITKPEKGE